MREPTYGVDTSVGVEHVPGIHATNRFGPVFQVTC
jgi:hypothetical protein